jgi:low affinity Fe/Cu permease
MRKFFSAVASKTAVWMGQPGAFIAALSACIIWAVSGPIFHYSDTWQLVINTATTVLTFLAVFLIQNSQNRDGAAIQAKLDELLRAMETARSQFIGIEHLNDQQIELIRAALEKQAESEKPARTKRKPRRAKQKTAPDTVDRLLDRF